MLQSEKLAQEIEDYKKGLSDPGDTDESTVGGEGGAGEGQAAAADTAQPDGTDGSKQKKKADDPAPSSDAATDNSGTDWEKRFKSFKVSADNTIHNLRTELAEMKVSYANLTTDLNNARSKLEEYARNERAAKTREKLLDPEITKVIGDDVATKIADTVDQTVHDAVDPIQSRLDNQNRKSVKEAEAERDNVVAEAKARFVSGLQEIVSRNGFDFTTINQDSNFINVFLKEADPVTGVRNETVLGYAMQNNDYLSAAKLFVAYGKSQKGGLTDDMLEPLGTSSGAGSQQSGNQEHADPNSIKESEINAFYDGGWKNMTIAEQDAFKKKVDRCAALNTIKIGV